MAVPLFGMLPEFFFFFFFFFCIKCVNPFVPVVS